MYSQLQQNPATGAASPRTVKPQKRNKPDPDARTKKTETPEKAENMAKEPEHNAPLTITLPDFVRSEVRAEVSQSETRITKEIGQVQINLTKEIGQVQISLTKDIGNIIRWIIGTGVVIIFSLIQLIADWPFSFSSEPAPVPAVQNVPAPAPAADPPAPLPLDAE